MHWARGFTLALALIVIGVCVTGCGDGPSSTATTVSSSSDQDIGADDSAHARAMRRDSSHPYDESFLPLDLQLDYRWQLPIPYDKNGTLINGWVEENLVLIESEISSSRHLLTAINRYSGEALWVVELSGPIMFPPTITPGHVYVVINTKIVSILRLSGIVRYSLEPGTDISIASQPLVLEPENYPTELSQTLVGTPLERIYLTSHTGKMYGLQVTGRIKQYYDAWKEAPGYSAADYRIEYLDYWKPQIVGHVITPIVKQGDYFYITNEDNQIMVYNDQGEERYKIYAQDRIICTPVVSGSPDDGLYFGSFDTVLYKYSSGVDSKIWDIHTEKRIFGPLYLDLADLKNRYLMCPLEDGGVWGLTYFHKVVRTPGGKERVSPDEDVEVRFRVRDGLECLATSQDFAYIGTRENTHRNSIYDVLHSEGIVCVNKLTGEKAWKVDLPLDFLFPLVTPPRDRIAQPAWLYFLTRTNHVIALSEFDPMNTHIRKRRTGSKVAKVINRQTNEEEEDRGMLRRAIGNGSYYFDYNK
ncbi:MAG TPA: hypothetical protein VL860_02525 [Planctomycetota bacterium]|nr:hypothetical protein [Planctomycetota bacterium]